MKRPSIGKSFCVFLIFIGLACITAFAPQTAYSTDTSATLTGFVHVYGAATPIVGAQIRVYHANTVGNVFFYAATGADGHFTLAVPPGSSSLMIEAQGYQRIERTFSCTAGGTETVDIAMTALTFSVAQLSGQVVDDATTAPLVRAYVYVKIPSADPTASPTTYYTNSNAEGRYLLLNIPVGSQVVYAQYSNYVLTTQTMEFHASDQLTANFRLKHTPPPVTTGTLSGFVHVAGATTPIAGASIVVSQSTSSGATPLNTTTGTDGRFTLTVPAGTSSLVVEKESYIRIERSFSVTAGGTESVDVAMTPLVVDAAQLSGKVVDAVTSAPLAKAYVYIRIPSATQSGGYTSIYAITNTEGCYLLQNIPVGSQIVNAACTNYLYTTQTLEFHANDHLVANFRLTLKPPTTGVIEGRVVSAKDSTPIVNASVYYARAESAANGWWQAACPSVSSVKTNSEGRYRIPDLAPGSYQMAVRAEKYQSGTHSATVVAGQSVTVDFSLEPIPSEATGVIEGNVVDKDTSAALAAARVYYILIPDDPIEFDSRISGSCVEMTYVETSSIGHYRIPNLKPGQYLLKASAADYKPLDRNVTVVSNSAVQANFALVKGETGKGTVYGRVTDALTSAPLKYAYVWVSPSGELSTTNASPLIIYGYARTNDKGEYGIPNIPAGDVVVHASLEGYRTMHVETKIEAQKYARVNFAMQTIPELEKGELEGRVIDDATSAPLSEALVTLIPDNPTTFNLSTRPDFKRTIYTNAEGRYSFSEVPVGGYLIRVEKRSYEGQCKWAAVAANTEVTVDFRLVHEVQHFGKLSGQVLDKITSAPIEGAWIRLGATESDYLGKCDDLTTLTDKNGAYSFALLREGCYAVYAAKAGYEPSTGKVQVIRDTTAKCDLALQPLQNIGAIEGNVTDALTTSPIVNALVFVPLFDQPLLSNEFTAPHARTDAQGHYRIEGVPAGKRIVVAYHPDYWSDAQAVLVVAGGTSTLDYGLLARPAERASVHVKCIDSVTHQVISGVNVFIPVSPWFDPTSDWNTWRATTDGSGNTTVNTVPTGQWSLVGSAHGYKSAIMPITVGGAFSPASQLYGSPMYGVQSIDVTVELDPLAHSTAASDWMLY